MATNFFNYDAALAACKTETEKALLVDWRPRLEAMTQEVVDQILAAFAAGKLREGFNAFYGKTTNLDALVAGSKIDVTNSAEFATRAANVREWFQTASIWAAKTLLTILVAGFLGF